RSKLVLASFRRRAVYHNGEIVARFRALVVCYGLTSHKPGRALLEYRLVLKSICGNTTRATVLHCYVKLRCLLSAFTNLNPTLVAGYTSININDQLVQRSGLTG